MTQDIETKAAEGLQYFTTIKKETGDIIALKDNAPEWLTDIVYSVHEQGAYLPDDYKYSFTEQAFESLSEGYEIDWQELVNHKLTDWLGSHAFRAEYVDQELSEGVQGLYNAIAAAYNAELREVYYTVAGELNSLMDEA